MILGFAAYIDEGQVEGICHQGTLGDGSRGHAGDSIHLGELLADEACNLYLDKGAEFGVGERLAVVAIERRLPAGGPGEGVGRLEFDGFYLEQFACKDVFKSFHNPSGLYKNILFSCANIRKNPELQISRDKEIDFFGG